MAMLTAFAIYSKKPAIFCPCLLLYVHKPALIVISQGLNIWKYGYMDRIVQFSNMFSNLIRMKSMIVTICLCRQVGIFSVFGGAVSYISLMYAHFDVALWIMVYFLFTRLLIIAQPKMHFQN